MDIGLRKTKSQGKRAAGCTGEHEHAASLDFFFSTISTGKESHIYNIKAVRSRVKKLKKKIRNCDETLSSRPGNSEHSYSNTALDLF